MSRSIHTPASLEEADQRLGDIERVLMARGWERAAILATVVRLPGSGGDRRSANRSNRGSQVCSAEQYAERGIPGLRDANTIRLYVQRWLDANGGDYPDPDSEVTEPRRKWPPVDKSDGGSRPTPTNIARQLDQNPALAQAAAQGLADGAIRHVEKQTNRDLSRAVDARIVRDAAADPNPPRITDRGKSTEELADDAYWAKVNAALHLLLDAKVKIADGVQPPAHIEILMQILVPEQDWDEAVRQEIGNML